ncbi:hypothetical protein [Pseudomonas viridiflava]|uniref:hypothetical protein n=1 Tax=Pseudomonas viridiflava TaxID=33069 RepID=UPI000F02BC9B|nr:hypothetical protein [Pseudomonas viridiflava]MEE3924706.1 hypothetical protein [Pseudomonas viridiflava]MEE3931052.1 hypothetical protein [Pseudomonas viridiflava]MEE3941796.1 hypothetical protein [Pseudomonas viridiflava]MEE3967597.1 hypothetical protein [Pseudomonas viridiflava]MEE3981825.1 hypothetical protein [Pseudomonas viridiflava]
MAHLITEKNAAVAAWQALLDDSTTLLATPGVHHKLLIRRAGELHSLRIVDRDQFSDMLELADGALAYAIEAQLDLPPFNGAS